MRKTGSCIVAYSAEGRVYMAADSLAVDSAGTQVELADPKILHAGTAAVGSVGSLRIHRLVERVLRENPCDEEERAFVEWLVESLAGEMDSAGGAETGEDWALLVGSAGRVYVVQHDFSWYSPEVGFEAEGCGADAAWAVLWLGWLGKLDLPPAELVRLAVYAAMSRNCRVGGRVVTAVV